MTNPLCSSLNEKRGAGHLRRPYLVSSRLLDRQSQHGLLDRDRGVVLQDRLLPVQRQLAALIIQLPESVEAVVVVAHHLAGQADVTELG
jgi:hypothetical protein